MKGQVSTEYFTILAVVLVVALVVVALVSGMKPLGYETETYKHMLVLTNGSEIECLGADYGSFQSDKTQSGNLMNNYYSLYRCNNMTYLPSEWNFSYEEERSLYDMKVENGVLCADGEVRDGHGCVSIPSQDCTGSSSTGSGATSTPTTGLRAVSGCS